MTDKKKRFLWGVCLAVLGIFVLTDVSYRIGQAGRTDIISGVFESGALRGNDAYRIDSTGDFRLYHGDVLMGDSGVGPGYINATATQLGTYYGLKVPFINGSGSSTAQGTVIIASGTASQYGIGSFSATLATNTILGISDGIYTSGTTGYMTINGYALVLTTGTVHIGDVLVSTDGTNAAGAAGYAGAKPTSPAAGTIIGVAFSSGPASGGLTLVKLAS